MLPAEETAQSIPAGVIAARSTAALPIALRRFSPSARSAALEAATSPLRILFPPADAALELDAEADAYVPIALKGIGGEPPLRWAANGRPIETAGATGEPCYWVPDGPGFATLSVVDARGETVSETVRLRLSE